MSNVNEELRVLQIGKDKDARIAKLELELDRCQSMIADLEAELEGVYKQLQWQ